jgi:5-methylcytosine-specific restriction endonuclease McrA
MLEIISEKLNNLRKRRKRYHLYHKEERNQKDKEWYEKNKEARKVSKHAYYIKHKEEQRARERERYADHKDEAHDKVRKRRAIQKSAVGGHFTTKQFRELCNFYGNRCLRCGRTDAKLTPDHVIPLGPPHSDEISNIQPLCLKCNQQKGTKTTDYRK